MLKKLRYEDKKEKIPSKRYANENVALRTNTLKKKWIQKT